MNAALLIDAALAGDAEGVKVSVAAGASINANTPAGHIALDFAARYGYVDVVRYPLSVGADVHADQDNAPYRVACHGHAMVVRVLVEAGADVHADDGVALRWVTINGHVDVVRYPSVAGADPIKARCSIDYNRRVTEVALDACADVMTDEQRAVIIASAMSTEFTKLRAVDPS